MTLKFMSGGSWREATDLKFMSGGAWQRADTIKMMIGGAWRTVYVYDIVGPGPVTSFKAEWNNAISDRCNVSWTQPGDADLSYVKLYVNRAGSSTGPWTFLQDFSGTGAKSYADTSVTFSSFTTHGPNTRSTTHYYRTLPYDVRGNPGTEAIVGSTGIGETVVRGMYSTPYYVLPTLSRTWRNTAWRADTTVLDGAGLYERVAQGYFSDPYTTQHNYGLYFYNTFPTGVNVSSATMYLARQNGGTGAGIVSYMRASAAPQSIVGAGTSPVGYTFTAATLGIPLATPNNGGTRAGVSSIPVSWVNGLQTGTYKSILLYTAETDAAPSTNYSVYSSTNEDVGFGVTPGYIAITHTG